MGVCHILLAQLRFDIYTDLNKKLLHGLKRTLANQTMASNFSFGLVVFSEVNAILVLLAQIIIVSPLYPIILG